MPLSSGAERPPEPVVGPASKKRRSEEPSKSKPEEMEADPMVEVVVEEPPPPSPASHRAQLAEAEFDRLATVGAKTAQAPTAVCRSDRGGTIWLAGFPTSENQRRFPEASLQITCFSDEVTQRGGVVLRNCMNLQVVPTSPKLRFDQWRLAWPTLKATYFQGEDVVIHCMAGRHRAAVVATLCRSLLMDEDLKQSEDFLKGQRDIDLPAIMYKQGIGAWMREARRQSVVGPPGPRVTGFCATSRSHLHLATAAQFARTSKRLLVRIDWWTRSSLRILMKRLLGAGQPAKPVSAVLRPVGRPASNCDDSWEMGVQKKSATCSAGVCTPRGMESTLCLRGGGHNSSWGFRVFVFPTLVFPPVLFPRRF